MLLRNKYILILVALLFMFACSNQPNGKEEPTDTTTSGKVNVVIDDGYQELFAMQIYTFESIYPNSSIHADYLPEGDALNRLINDSCKVVVMNRDLTPTERKTFESKNIFPISTKIGEDAIALIVNPENPDSVLSVDQLKAFLLGKDTSWNQMNPKTTLGGVNLVFDSKGSGNIRYMKDTLLGGQEFSKNVFAVNSHLEVIDYVSKNKGAIGFLSVNWVGDMDDPRVQERLKQVKVLYISKDGEEPVKPEQANIQTKDYAFTRNIYMINRQTRAGLGMGFVSFVAGEKGQLMLLKAGLIPGFPQERMIKVEMD